MNDESRAVQPLCDFRLAAVDVIRGLVDQGSGKLSPNIDVVSTASFESNIDTLTAVFTDAVNQSVELST